MPQKCSDPVKKICQMDMVQKDSWYSLTPEITHNDRPAVFAPKHNCPFTKQILPSQVKQERIRKNNSTNFGTLS